MAGYLAGGLEVTEVFMVYEVVEEAMREVPGLQAAAGVSSNAKGIVLAPSQGQITGCSALERIWYQMQQVSPQQRYFT